MNYSFDNGTGDTIRFRQALRSDTLFILETILLAAVGPFALALQLIFLLLLRKHFTIHHANVRLFMWNLSMSLLCQSIYFIVNAVVNILYLTTSPAALSFTLLSCQLTGVFTSVSSVADICSTFGMGIDRLYATYRRQFDDPKRSGLLSKLFVFGSWSITAIVNVYGLIKNGEIMSKTPMKRYCHVLLYSIDTPTISGIAYVYMILELASVGLPIAVLLINKRIYMEFGLKTSSSSNSHNLQQRFALSNNVSVSLMLLPVDILRSLSYIQALIIMTILRYTNQSSTILGAELSSLATVISIPCVCACPIVCIYMDKRLRRAFLNYWTRCQSGRCRSNATVEASSESVVELPNLATTSGEYFSSNFHQHHGASAKAKKNKLTRDQSVVADCVVDFKVNPEKSQNILAQLWDRKIA